MSRRKKRNYRKKRIYRKRNYKTKFDIMKYLKIAILGVVGWFVYNRFFTFQGTLHNIQCISERTEGGVWMYIFSPVNGVKIGDQLVIVDDPNFQGQYEIISTWKGRAFAFEASLGDLVNDKHADGRDKIDFKDRKGKVYFIRSGQ